MSELGNVTLEGLFEFRNRDLLDHVVRGISLSADLDYPTALHSLQAWAEDAASLAGHNESGRLRLRAVLEQSPVRLDRLEADVDDLGKRGAEAERKVLSDAGLPHTDEFGTRWTKTLDLGLPGLPGLPPPQTAVEADAAGQVPLAASANKGKLLADPVEVERQYQEAREESRRYDGHQGFETFKRDLRASVEAGIDLVESLRYQGRQFAAARQLQKAERVQLAREARERQHRAEERALDRALGRRDG